jgi:nucleoside-diphosphate-sugar epimerase
MHMTVTVFGATGGVGSQIVDQLRSRGHTVTAYVRNPSKVPRTRGEDVTVVVGELSDAAAIDRAVQGANAVVSALGPSLSRKVTGLPLVEGTRNIVAAMQRHGVRRYVGNGTPSVLDPRERPTWQTRLSTLMAKTFLRRAYDELVGMSEIVMTSGLNWTIVRFLAPKDGPACRRPRQGFYGHDRLGFGVTRAAIAAFTAAQVDDARYIGAAPAISN